MWLIPSPTGMSYCAVKWGRYLCRRNAAADESRRRLDTELTRRQSEGWAVHRCLVCQCQCDSRTRLGKRKDAGPDSAAMSTTARRVPREPHVIAGQCSALDEAMKLRLKRPAHWISAAIVASSHLHCSKRRWEHFRREKNSSHSAAKEEPSGSETQMEGRQRHIRHVMRPSKWTGESDGSCEINAQS